MTNQASPAVTSRTFVRLRPTDLPLALAELHRSLPVGARVDVELPLGTAEIEPVMSGGGFDRMRVRDEPALGCRVGATWVRAERALTLPDYVGADMRLLMCGLNPSVYSAEAGAGFARPGNRFWPAMVAAGLCDRPIDPHRLLLRDRIGMTDLVKRATPRASDLRPDEYRSGVERVRRLVAWLRPAATCVVGLAGWRTAVDRGAVAGEQPGGLGDRPVYLMPNTSGLNAHCTPADFRDHLVAAAALADGAR